MRHSSMVTIMNFLAIVFHSILFLMRERGNSELTPCVYLLYFMNLEDDEYFFMNLLKTMTSVTDEYRDKISLFITTCKP